MYDGLRSNYYALMISIIKGCTIEQSLGLMGIRPYNVSESGRNKKLSQDMSEQCAVLRCATGSSFREIGRCLGINYGTVQRAINRYKKEHINEVLYESVNN